jgi:two-component system response regulator NreC
MNGIINVGLVEDQVLFMEGMKAIIASWPGIQVVFESADGWSVTEKLKQAAIVPDVMLVDLSLPALGQKEFSGIDVTRTILENWPNMKIIILSVHDDENFIAQLIEEGAHAYLIKDANPKEVYEAIAAVHYKGSYINERTLKALQHNLGYKKKAPKKIDLQITKREAEILQQKILPKNYSSVLKQLMATVITCFKKRAHVM